MSEQGQKTPAPWVPLIIAALAIKRAFPPLAGLALVSYGAWLAWKPSGFIILGALILADQIADRVAGGGE